MKHLILVSLSLNLFCTNSNFSEHTDISILKSGIFEIVQKWSQEPSGHSRKVFVKVPDNKLKKYPVVIVLHGNGGSGDRFVNKFNYIDNHIIIAPQGYLKSWNISKEKSKAPDINFIAEIISYLKEMKNIESENIYSHQGLTYGGLIVNQNIKLNDFISVFSELLKFCHNIFILSLIHI